MAKYLMQAVSGGGGGDGALYSWSAGAADWAAAGFPGPGTALYTAVQKVLRDDLAGVGAGTEAGQKLEWDGAAWFNRRGWITPGIDLTGAVDATATILAALNSRVGACVELPDGIIRMDSGITIPTGRTLTGQPRGNRIGHREFSSQTNVGTLIRAYGTGVLFTMAGAGNVTVTDLEIWYPNQEIDATPDVYDWTFSVPANAHFCTFQNLSVLNPYKLLSAQGANGLTIDNVESTSSGSLMSRPL
jgi:hypothetical protein